jgi:hypothetical protein
MRAAANYCLQLSIMRIVTNHCEGGRRDNHARRDQLCSPQSNIRAETNHARLVQSRVQRPTMRAMINHARQDHHARRNCSRAKKTMSNLARCDE